jgi:hypothetical protein
MTPIQATKWPSKILVRNLPDRRDVTGPGPGYDTSGLPCCQPPTQDETSRRVAFCNRIGGNRPFNVSWRCYCTDPSWDVSGEK